MSAHSILLIDGSKASRAIIAKSINAKIDDVILISVESASTALEHCQTNSFDIIITAMSLPDMQAQDFAEKLRNECNNSVTPVIMMSGDFMQNIQNNTASSYINGYYDKSKGNEHLIEYIQSYLSRRVWNKAESCHVLFVEDSPTVTKAVTNMLDTNDYTYQHVTNATDALMLLSPDSDTNQAFDLMLTDIQLDGLMTGDDLIREIRFGLGLMPKDLPILVSTSPSKDRIGHVNNIIAAGANDFIEKPIVESLLITRISNLVQKTS